MNLKRWTQNGFALALTCVLFAGGMALTTEPAQATHSFCPIFKCPSNLNEWTQMGCCKRSVKGQSSFICYLYWLQTPSGVEHYCYTNCFDL